MIYVNDILVEPKTFPDGTSSLRLDLFEHANSELEGVTKITWKYDNESEYMMLWNIVHHIREQKPRVCGILLFMPYIPNARMDRVKNDDEVFTLKWFAKFINALSFDAVVVEDPHSNVSIALIDNCLVMQVADNISRIFAELEDDNCLLCYPDEGATKKYSEQIGGEYVFGIKHRDWRTGEILGLELTHPEIVKDRNVLIVDDICSKGGTFMHTARALKAAGAKKIYLYVTHCENTISQGELLTTDLIEHIYTTDSIYRGNYDKVTVLL